MAATLTAAARHGSTDAVSLLDDAIERMWQDAETGNESDCTNAIRDWLIARAIETVIPCRDNQSGSKAYDRDAYRDRPIIERTINQGLPSLASRMGCRRPSLPPTLDCARRADPAQGSSRRCQASRCEPRHLPEELTTPCRVGHSCSHASSTRAAGCICLMRALPY